jgi:hypothetical protein
MSIQQMRNLNMTLDCRPEAIYITCEALGAKEKICDMATSLHAVLNLADVKKPPKNRASGRINSSFLAIQDWDESYLTCLQFVEQSYAICPACVGKHRPHTYKDGCNKKNEQVKDEVPPPPIPSKSARIVGDPNSPLPQIVELPEPEPRRPVDSKEEATESIPKAEQKIKEEQVEPSKAYEKINKKMSDKTELYKLHIKHYHMSVNAFKHRTSELKLLPSVYEKYQEVVKECEHCNRQQVRPTRSRVSGLRANVFGDLIFIDHADVKISGKVYVVLIVVDAATSFISAYAQNNKDSEHTIENLREWMETFQCVPKALCAHMAFTGHEFSTFYKIYNIKPLMTGIVTGSATPWPNRAEAAVRLFKRHLDNFLAEVDKDPELRGTTPRALFRKAAMARNTTVTYGGKTPLELAMGRRPTDIITVEHQDPEQLSTDLPKREANNRKLHELAMKTYLEARQREDRNEIWLPE